MESKDFQQVYLWPIEKNSLNISKVKRGTEEEEEDLNSWFPNSSLSPLHIIWISPFLCLLWKLIRIASKSKKSEI